MGEWAKWPVGRPHGHIMHREDIEAIHPECLCILDCSIYACHTIRVFRAYQRLRAERRQPWHRPQLPDDLEIAAFVSNYLGAEDGWYTYDPVTEIWTYHGTVR